MNSDVITFLQQHDWQTLGTWKEPPFLACMVARGVTSVEHGSALPFAPRAYAILNFRQYVVREDYDKNVMDVEALLTPPSLSPPSVRGENVGGEAFEALKTEMEAGIAELNSFRPTELTADIIRRYIFLITQRARQWYEIMVADSALSLLYPMESAREISERFIPSSLLAKTALPKKLFPMIEEQMHLLEMASAFKTGGDIEHELEAHVAKFSWMNSICWWDEPFSKEHYRAEVEKAASSEPDEKLQKNKVERAERYARAKTLLDTLKKQCPETHRLIDIIRDLTDLKEENWDAVSRAGVHMRPLFKKAAKEQHLSYLQLLFLTPDEMMRFFETATLPVPVDVLNERMREFFVLCAPPSLSPPSVRGENVGGSIISKTRAILEKEPPAITELTGTPIWQGKVTGTACVLHSADEVQKMKQGQILVCPMSDPDYMPAIHKAAAIVADQGGLLCHAAIVARELQIPCVVGTEHATKWIASGDAIEVDAARGTVKKI